MANILESFYNAIPTSLYTGFSVVLDVLPPVPTNCISITSQPTGGSQKYFGQSDSIDEPLIVLEVRSSDFDTGIDTAESIRDYLDKMHNDAFLAIIAVGSVLNLGRDQDNNRHFMVQFRLMIKE